ncbi:MAG: hypothetical protein WC465_01925 [Patescibacteria group bacterium]
MPKNILAPASKLLFLDLIGEILFFPIWWYTTGLKNTMLYLVQGLKNSNYSLGLSLLLKNIFQPMYGQYDRAGRAISLLMRLLIIIYKLILFIFILAYYVAVVLFWLVLPPLVVWGVISNWSALWQK